MQCPGCNAELPASEVREGDLQLAGDARKRMMRFVYCSCGATCGLMAWTGWERWYLVRWNQTHGACNRTGPDYAAFYLRDRGESKASLEALKARYR